jgi:uncharacterized membrane protein (UPF0127 family)
VLVVADTRTVLAERARWARSRSARRRGLVGRPCPALGEALVIDPARQVHTLGMRYAIDVVFCDERWIVVHVVRGLRPWRVTRWVRRARYAVELGAGGAGPDVRGGSRIAVEGV